MKCMEAVHCGIYAGLRISAAVRVMSTFRTDRSHPIISLGFKAFATAAAGNQTSNLLHSE